MCVCVCVCVSLSWLHLDKYGFSHLWDTMVAIYIYVWIRLDIHTIHMHTVNPQISFRPMLLFFCFSLFPCLTVAVSPFALHKASQRSKNTHKAKAKAKAKQQATNQPTKAGRERVQYLAAAASCHPGPTVCANGGRPGHTSALLLLLLLLQLLATTTLFFLLCSASFFPASSLLLRFGSCAAAACGGD